MHDKFVMEQNELTTAKLIDQQLKGVSAIMIITSATNETTVARSHACTSISSNLIS